jgi:serum amyloid A protein
LWARIANPRYRDSDKYFHSKANFIASLRGEGGKAAAIEMSLLRELTDYYIKGDPIQACLADMTANIYGMDQAQKLSYFVYYTFSYGDALPKYRPSSLPSQY